MSEHADRLKQLRSEIHVRVTVICIESGLFDDVCISRLNAMLDEIKAAVIKCKPDPPGMVR